MVEAAAERSSAATRRRPQPCWPCLRVATECVLAARGAQGDNDVRHDRRHDRRRPDHQRRQHRVGDAHAHHDDRENGSYPGAQPRGEVKIDLTATVPSTARTPAPSRAQTKPRLSRRARRAPSCRPPPCSQVLMKALAMRWASSVVKLGEPAHERPKRFVEMRRPHLLAHGPAVVPEDRQVDEGVPTRTCDVQFSHAVGSRHKALHPLAVAPLTTQNGTHPSRSRVGGSALETLLGKLQSVTDQFHW